MTRVTGQDLYQIHTNCSFKPFVDRTFRLENMVNLLKIRYKEPLKEMKSWRLYQDCLGEIFMSFLLVFVNTTANMRTSAARAPSTETVSIAPGFLVAVMIESFGHLTLAVFNPAVTFVFVLIGRLSILKGVFYTVVQLGGAILGAYISYVLASDYARTNMKPPGLGVDVTEAQGVILEWILTTLLITVVLGATDVTHRAPSMIFSIAIGFCVVVCILTGVSGWKAWKILTIRTTK